MSQYVGTSTSTANGIEGNTSTGNRSGVYGHATGSANGVYADSGTGYALEAWNGSTTNATAYANNQAGGCAVQGVTSSTTLAGATSGVYGTNSGNGGAGVYGENTATGVLAVGPGVCGTQAGPGNGVQGSNSGSGNGVSGTAVTGVGVSGVATTGAGIGVQGVGPNSGVVGQPYVNGAYGVYGTVYGNTSGTAVYGQGGSSATYAGYFSGNVDVTNNFTVGGTKSFQIDHPLDPANKWLMHSCVESPDMMNVYSGVATTDENGEAEIQMPSYFDALNRDFRYQLTAIGGPAPNLHVKTELKSGRFTIAGASASQRISWQVTGIRQDAYARANPVVVERDKGPKEKGLYRHPEVHGQPEEKGIEWETRQRFRRELPRLPAAPAP